MGIYYYLVNDTKKQYLHVDYYAECGVLAADYAVCYALASYLIHHQGDLCRLLEDKKDVPDYNCIGSITYDFEDGFESLCIPKNQEPRSETITLPFLGEK